MYCSNLIGYRFCCFHPNKGLILFNFLVNQCSKEAVTQFGMVDKLKQENIEMEVVQEKSFYRYLDYGSEFRTFFGVWILNHREL